MGRGRRRLSASLLLLTGCTSAPSPTHVTLPSIPLEAFFANRDTSYDHKVSPDGTRLAWIGMADGRLTVLVAAGKDVQYVVLASEGHGAFGDPTSALRMYGAIEQFLGACLGL